MDSKVITENNYKIPGWIVGDYIFCLLCGILFSVTNSPIFGYVALMASSVVVIKAKKSEVFLFFLGIQFLRVVLKVNLGFTNMTSLLFLYVIWLFRFIFLKGKLRRIEILPFALLLIDIVISAMWGITKIGDNVLWTISLLILINTILDDNEEFDMSDMVSFYCLAVWGICIINILKEFSMYGQSLMPEMYGTYINGSYFSFGKAYSEVAGGNGIALDTIIGIALCCILLSKKEKKHRNFFIISVVAFLYFGLICVARAFYIELALFVVLLILSQVKDPIKFLKAILIITIIGVVAFVAFSDYIIPVWEAVQIRFALGNEDRIGLLESASSVVRSNKMVMMFGAGSYYPEIFNFTAHNIFYDIFVSLGIFGTIIYGYTILVPSLKYLLKTKKMNLLYLSPILMFVSYKMISGSMRDIPLYYMLAMLLIFYKRMCQRRS